MNPRSETTTTLSQQVKDSDASSYDPLAATFDRLSRRVTAPIAEQLVVTSAVKAGDRVLDVGTGTGIVSGKMADRVGADGQVLGIDYSRGMLTTASQNFGQAGNLQFIRMDAERLALPNDHFDIVTSLYVLRHLPNPDIALGEMRRVLKPGGRLVIGIGSGVPRNSTAIFAAVARELGTRLRKLRHRHAGACELIDGLVTELIPEQQSTVTEVHSTDHIFSTTALMQWLKASGFSSIAQRWTGHRFEFDSPQEFWVLQSTLSSFARKRIQHASPEQREELQWRFLSYCERVMQKRGALVYHPGALIVTANKPDC